jgi:hypothetical protein
MRSFSLKKFSFGLALFSFVCAGAASAQSLAGVTTRLDKTLDSGSAKTGEAITAKLDSSVTTPDGVKLPRGTELIGTVAEVKSAPNGPVSLTLVFNTAKMKDGKQIPVKATLVGAYTASEGDDASYGSLSMAPAPTKVNPDDTFNQQPGALRHITMTSAVKNSASGTFTSSNGNFKLTAGTYLQFGVDGPASGSHTNAAE